MGLGKGQKTQQLVLGNRILRSGKLNGNLGGVGSRAVCCGAEKK